jgi:dihydropteroate synthase
MRVYPLSSRVDLSSVIEQIGCDTKALPIFKDKTNVIPVRADAIPLAIANIIKQEMISAKGDAVVHREVISGKAKKSDVILLGTPSVYSNFISKIRRQEYPSLIELSIRLGDILDNIRCPIKPQTLKNGTILDYKVPVVMGILNITEDSFYDGGRYGAPDLALNRSLEMINEGAGIIDIGGESTRPGAKPVSVETELNRVLTVISAIRKESNIPISIDTYKSEVAKKALEAGADIVNDISGLSFDKETARIVADFDCPVVIMHIKGTPSDMQKNPVYDDVVGELVDYFDGRIELALSAGIRIENIIIDPGIGFGKRLEDNCAILRNLETFRKYGVPILVGVSRKSMVGALLGGADTDDRLYGTMGAHSLAILNGANIIRAHDIKAHSDLIKVISGIDNT